MSQIHSSVLTTYLPFNFPPTSPSLVSIPCFSSQIRELQEEVQEQTVRILSSVDPAERTSRPPPPQQQQLQLQRSAISNGKPPSELVFECNAFLLLLLMSPIIALSV